MLAEARRMGWRVPVPVPVPVPLSLSVPDYLQSYWYGLLLLPTMIRQFRRVYQ